LETYVFITTNISWLKLVIKKSVQLHGW
jgi:hypothetical protein